MTTERHRIEVAGIAIDVIRKDVKNLHVGIYPPHGRVRVAAPRRLTDDAVRLAIVSRLGWIRRQRRSFAEQERQSPRQMVSGECHYFQGRRYRLSVVHGTGPATVRIRNRSSLELKTRVDASHERREAALERWYREKMRTVVQGLIARWEPRVGVRVADWGIRKMKTRWGTCNADARRVWLNLELIKKPPACMEYIIVHEMVHLLERHHNERFLKHMDRLVPRWRVLRAELNRAPLAHADWEY